MLGFDFHLREDSLVFLKHVCLILCHVSANVLGDLAWVPCSRGQGFFLGDTPALPRKQYGLCLGSCSPETEPDRWLTEVQEKPAGWPGKRDRAGEGI